MRVRSGRREGEKEIEIEIGREMWGRDAVEALKKERARSCVCVIKPVDESGGELGGRGCSTASSTETDETLGWFTGTQTTTLLWIHRLRKIV